MIQRLKEDERAKGGGEGSLFPSSNKSCLKVVSRETSSFSSLRFVFALGMAPVRGSIKWGQSWVKASISWCRFYIKENLNVTLFVVEAFPPPYCPSYYPCYCLPYCSPEDLIHELL
jgi:hypothetical protein